MKNLLLLIFFNIIFVCIGGGIEYTVDKQKDFIFKIKKGECFCICMEKKELIHYLDREEDGYDPLFDIYKIPENYPLNEGAIKLSLEHQVLAKKHIKQGGQFAYCKFYGFSIKTIDKLKGYNFDTLTVTNGINIDKEDVLKPYLFMNENAIFSEWKEVKGVKGLFFSELDFVQLTYRKTKIIVYKTNDWELIKKNIPISELYVMFEWDEPEIWEFYKEEDETENEDK